MIVRLFTALCLLLCLLAQLAISEPIQWEENGHWYEVVLTFTSWSEAKELAEAMYFDGLQGHLATITSEDENNWTWQLVEPVMADVPGVWLGGYQDPPDTQPPDANWRWVTDEPWEYTNWANGEPNDYGGVEGGLEFWELSYSFWNDQPDSRPNAFLVEYEAGATANRKDTWGIIKNAYKTDK